MAGNKVQGKVQRSVWLDPELDKALGHRAVEEGVSKSEIIARAMQKELGFTDLKYKVGDTEYPDETTAREAAIAAVGEEPGSAIAVLRERRPDEYGRFKRDDSGRPSLFRIGPWVQIDTACRTADGSVRWFDSMTRDEQREFVEIGEALLRKRQEEKAGTWWKELE